MALNFPEIITYIFDNNIRPKLNAVQKRLLLSDGEMQKVVLTLSKIFCYDFDGTSNPILKFLQDSDGEMLKVVLTLPEILCYDFDGTINPDSEIFQITNCEISSSRNTQHWGRLVKAPPKKKKNVILDYFTSCASSSETVDATASCDSPEEDGL
eukprot:CAMPEP_0194445824 /NCGR_PEP_ID=MMETSP0176-20130528/128079_1 /TAXON_ID=216777 /ORGANISM="Proboscia alata, Strain PI-D3" /LENGTH=153 /DNA_ID=CAMNT_0039272439 /DNA_START=697 /DNA_END=1157 /DNA_ORIENTATION=+